MAGSNRGGLACAYPNWQVSRSRLIHAEGRSVDSMGVQLSLLQFQAGSSRRHLPLAEVITGAPAGHRSDECELFCKQEWIVHKGLHVEDGPHRTEVAVVALPVESVTD